jgi:hypothetical protein
MKMTMTGRLGIAAALCGIFLMTACAKKSGSPAGGGTGSGTFSVAIDGKTVGGTSSINNAVVIIQADPTAAFDTMGDIFVYMQVPGDSIGFHLPDRTGVTEIGNSSYATIYGVYTIPGTVYIFGTVTVNVSTLTSTRIKGTFSGGLETSLLAGQGTTAQLTNGSFDLPIIP